MADSLRQQEKVNPKDRPDYLPLWKQWALNTAYRSPRTSAAFQKFYRRLR